MINDIKVYGSQSTTWHNFTFTSERMTITVSAGEYWRGGASTLDDAGINVVRIEVEP